MLRVHPGARAQRVSILVIYVVERVKSLNEW